MRSNTTRFAAVILLAMAVLLSIGGCATTAGMETPVGFARFSESDVYRIVTPEGIVLRARVELNEPAQTLEFWVEALTRHLKETGYVLVDTSAFTSNEGPGTWIEWLAPVGEDDWIYLTAIVVTDEHIMVVESAGPYSQYQTHRRAIREALETLELDQGIH